MKETRMPPAKAANLVANSGNTIYGVGVIGEQSLVDFFKLPHRPYANKLLWHISTYDPEILSAKGDKTSQLCISIINYGYPWIGIMDINKSDHGYQ